MSHITKIAAVENTTAIWEYDPTLENNRVLGGSLDVISAIRTLAIKVKSTLSQINSHSYVTVFSIDTSVRATHRVFSEHPAPLRTS